MNRRDLLKFGLLAISTKAFTLFHNIPLFASGGWLDAGDTLVLLHGNEAIVPLSQMRRFEALRRPPFVVNN